MFDITIHCGTKEEVLAMAKLIAGETACCSRIAAPPSSLMSLVTDTNHPGVADEPVNANPPTFDGNGFPWDARIHSSSRALTGEGAWRRKRGVADALIQQVEAELAAPVPVPPAAAPVPVPPAAAPVPVPPAAVAVPVPPAAVAVPVPPAGPITAPTIVNLLSARARTEGRQPMEIITPILQMFGLTILGELFSLTDQAKLDGIHAVLLAG